MGQVSRFQEKQQNRRQKAIFNIAFTLILVTVGIVTYQLFTASNTSKKQLLKKESNKDRREETEDKAAKDRREKKTEDKRNSKR